MKQYNNVTIKLNKIKVALIKPPIIGHKYRGTGMYTEELYNSLKKRKDISVELIDYERDPREFDLLHYPYFDPFFLTLPVFPHKKFIVTVHDLIPLRFTDHFPPGLKGKIKWFIQKTSLQKASSIITDSIASKEDIIKYAEIVPSRISTIYLGVDQDFRMINGRGMLDRIKEKYGWPKKYILYVGDINYNKNLDNLIKAFKVVTHEIKDLYLILAGPGFKNDSSQLKSLINLYHTLRLDNKIRILGYVDKENLINLYNLASLYIQPSFAEGFGLPVLEAMACGCPTVCANTSSLPEIASDATYYVDPYKIEDIASGIIKVLKDRKLKEELAIKGLRQVKSFTWEKCAEETIKIYKTVIL